MFFEKTEKSSVRRVAGDFCHALSGVLARWLLWPVVESFAHFLLSGPAIGPEVPRRSRELSGGEEQVSDCFSTSGLDALGCLASFGVVSSPQRDQSRRLGIRAEFEDGQY